MPERDSAGNPNRPVGKSDARSQEIARAGTGCDACVPRGGIPNVRRRSWQPGLCGGVPRRRQLKWCKRTQCVRGEGAGQTHRGIDDRRVGAVDEEADFPGSIPLLSGQGRARSQTDSVPVRFWLTGRPAGFVPGISLLLRIRSGFRLICSPYVHILSLSGGR